MEKIKIRMIPLFLLLLIFFGVSTHSALAISQVQIDILMALYNATNGDATGECKFVQNKQGAKNYYGKRVIL